MIAYAHITAAARAELEVAAKADDTAAANIATLRERAAEAANRRAEALAALRSGELSESIGGARVAVADADAADLQGLIVAAEAAAAQTARARVAAEQAVELAHRQLEHAERAEKIAALDRFIADAERKLCQAIGRRFTLGVEHGGTRALSAHWRRSDELHRAIAYGVPPQVTQ